MIGLKSIPMNKCFKIQKSKISEQNNVTPEDISKINLGLER